MVHTLYLWSKTNYLHLLDGSRTCRIHRSHNRRQKHKHAPIHYASYHPRESRSYMAFQDVRPQISALLYKSTERIRLCCKFTMSRIPDIQLFLHIQYLSSLHQRLMLPLILDKNSHYHNQSLSHSWFWRPTVQFAKLPRRHEVMGQSWGSRCSADSHTNCYHVNQVQPLQKWIAIGSFGHILLKPMFLIGNVCQK